MHEWPARARWATGFAAAVLAAAAVGGCGGDDAGDAVPELEPLTVGASPEEQEALRDEAARVRAVLDDGLRDLRDVRSLDALDRRAEAARTELDASAERLRDLEVPEDHEDERAQLEAAVRELEQEVGELERAVDERDLPGALRAAANVSVRDVEKALERAERAAS